MNTYDESLEYKFCLNCKKGFCKGNCQDYKNYMKFLRLNNLIPKRGKLKNKQKIDV